MWVASSFDILVVLNKNSIRSSSYSLYLLFSCYSFQLQYRMMLCRTNGLCFSCWFLVSLYFNCLLEWLWNMGYFQLDISLMVMIVYLIWFRNYSFVLWCHIRSFKTNFWLLWTVSTQKNANIDDWIFITLWLLVTDVGDGGIEALWLWELRLKAFQNLIFITFQNSSFKTFHQRILLIDNIKRKI